MATFRKIFSLIKPYWDRIIAGIAVSLLISATSGAIAWSIKPALDKIFIEKNYSLLKLLPFGIFLLFTAKGLLTFIHSYLMKSAATKLISEIRNKLYNHILHLPISYFSKESSGNVISRIMYDVKALSNLISGVIKTFIVEIPTVLVLLAVAFYRSWSLTIITLILLPFIAYSSRKLGKKIKKKSKEAQKKVASLTNKIGEAVMGAKIIKVFNSENLLFDKFKKENQQFYREVIRSIRSKEFASLIVDVTTGIGIALILLYGGSLVIKGSLSPGGFISILVAIYMIFPPIKKLGDAYTSLQEIKASMERIDKLLDTDKEENGSIKISRFEKSICYENVSFAYHGNNQLVLREINLTIKAGEIVAIVGHSGAGKSTLVDLIPRFNKPTSGKLKIDGIDINEIEIHSLRSLIGIVSQDVILFNDTVKNNIAFGKPEATDDEIIMAARQAYADEFIDKLPEKYNTIIGERGVKLSGGQRQRIAIARAILKNPPILILDEATSSLDSISESLIQKALEKLSRERTTIVIAHRLSTIRNADRIVVLEKGRIIDIGSHEELLKNSFIYKNLYNTYVFVN